jgi:putative hydrolase of the HAD superfamily
MVEVLDELVPGNVVGASDVRPFLQQGFPWQTPDVEHLNLSTPDLWWDHLMPTLRNAYEQVGVATEFIDLALTEVRRTYCDPLRFELFPDVKDALSELRNAGWRVTILSNHVPELPAIVNGLGLGELIDEVFSSALIGYEKPHPHAFKAAIGLSNANECFVIGDDPVADVLGAEQSGIRALLVRDTTGLRGSPIDVRDAVELILSE